MENQGLAVIFKVVFDGIQELGAEITVFSEVSAILKIDDFNLRFAGSFQRFLTELD